MSTHDEQTVAMIAGILADYVPDGFETREGVSMREDAARRIVEAMREVEPPLEEVLDRERFTAQLFGASWKAPEGQWMAVVNDRTQGRSFIGKDFEGFGDTIDAAIRDGVAKAESEATHG